MDDAEDGGVGADPERQRGQSNRRERRPVRQRAEGGAQVRGKGSHIDLTHGRMGSSGRLMTIDDEIRRAARLLESLIQVTGESQEELERQLEASPGYLSRLLAGRVELKLRHILAILRVLEIEPSLFFQTLYSDEDLTGTVTLDELRQRVKSLGVGSEPAPKSGVGMNDLERLVQEAVQDALSRRKPEG